MLNSRSTAWILQLFAALPFAAESTAENWSQFRGPNTDGIVNEARLPTEWGPDKNILWKIDLPGAGWSQPVAWGERIFITTAEAANQLKPDIAKMRIGGGVQTERKLDYRWKVLCLDAANGKTLWQQTAREGHPTIAVNVSNTYASETPVTDGERLIAYFGMTGIYCYDLNGNRLWTRNLGSYPMMFGWGTGSSPILFGDKVYIQCDNEKASFLVALDKKTGQDVWRIEREEKSNWCTPYIWRNKNRNELVTAGGGQMRSYDPESGRLLWSMAGYGRTASTPVGDADLLFVDSGNHVTGENGIFAAIRPGASGDISLKEDVSTNAFVAWSGVVKGYRIASPILCQGCLYVLEQDGGIIHCIDAKTGEEHYRKRLPNASGFAASAVAKGNKLYFVDQNCHTTVFEAGPELKVIASNNLDEMCFASPAIVGDHLLIRTVDHLYAIGQK
jgi:outer membrane protein assembly factor BamB